MTHPLSVAVLGPGGTGGLLAALLSRSGHRVLCLAGAETAEKLRRDGITVRSPQFGAFTAAVDADTELCAPVDVCLVTVKHTALDAALTRVPPAVLGDALLVPLLNGVEHPATLRGRYRPDRVAPAVIRVESTRVAPGVIEHGSPFTEIDLAGDTVPRARLEALAALLTECGTTAAVAGDESAALWAKMAFLAPFALLTTRYGVPLGTARTRHRAELEALVAETAAVGRPAAPPPIRCGPSPGTTPSRPPPSPPCSATPRPAARWSWTPSAAPCCGRPSGTAYRCRWRGGWCGNCARRDTDHRSVERLTDGHSGMPTHTDRRSLVRLKPHPYRLSGLASANRTGVALARGYDL